jgi:hypothetical protein
MGGKAGGDGLLSWRGWVAKLEGMGGKVGGDGWQSWR